MTDSIVDQFAALLAATENGADREKLIKRARMLAMNEVKPEAFEPPIITLGDYLDTPIEVPPSIVWPTIVVRGELTATLGRAGKGKRQPDDCQILTPTGWKRIDSLCVGDSLIDPDGGESEVTGIYPSGIQNVYEVKFSDGTSTRCGPEHLWTVSKWNHAKTKTISLQEMIDEGTKNARGDSLWYTPMPEIDFRKKSLQIDPYILGVLLGDGSLSNDCVGFVVDDQEIVDNVRQKLPIETKIVKCNNHPYRYRINGPSQYSRNPMQTALSGLDLKGANCHSKFIPQEYFTSSYEQRLELLQGLIDTDGHIKKNGTVVFYSSNKKLIEDVRTLVRSLGGTATLNERGARGHKEINGQKFHDNGPSFNSTIRINNCPSKLKRKAERWCNNIRPYRAIDSIVKVDDARCRCISTNATRNLYVTDDYVVTHNTTLNLNRLIKWSCGRPLFDTLVDEEKKPYLMPYRPLKVLIIENEGSAGMFHHKMGVMVNNCGTMLSTEDRDLIRENIHIWGDGGYSGLKLDDATMLSQVRAGCEKVDPDVIFVEPFRSLWKGEENSSTEMANMVDALVAMATDYGSGVIISHHERKSGAGEDGELMSAGRGSTVLEGVVAVMENFQSVVGGDFREITWSKNRYLQPPPVTRMEYDNVLNWYRHVPLDEIESHIVRIIGDGEGWSVKEIGEELGEADHRVRATLKRLVEDKTVKAIKVSGSNEKKYRLPSGSGDNGGLTI